MALIRPTLPFQRTRNGLLAPTAGPDFRTHARTSTVARKPKNQLAKLSQCTCDWHGLSTTCKRVIHLGGPTGMRPHLPASSSPEPLPSPKKPADRVSKPDQPHRFGLEEKSCALSSPHAPVRHATAALAFHSIRIKFSSVWNSTVLMSTEKLMFP